MPDDYDNFTTRDDQTPYVPRAVRLHEHTAGDKLLAVVAGPPGAGGAPLDYFLRGMANRWTENIDLKIGFQTAPVHEVGVTGVTMEALLAVIIDRLEGFQSGKFPCEENECAIRSLRLALYNLNARTTRLTGEGDPWRLGTPSTESHHLMNAHTLVATAMEAVSSHHPENTTALNALKLAAAALAGTEEVEIDLGESNTVNPLDGPAFDPEFLEESPQQEPGARAPGTPDANSRIKSIVIEEQDDGDGPRAVCYTGENGEGEPIAAYPVNLGEWLKAAQQPIQTDRAGERESRMGNAVLNEFRYGREFTANQLWNRCAGPGIAFDEFWGVLESLRDQGLVTLDPHVHPVAVDRLKVRVSLAEPADQRTPGTDETEKQIVHALTAINRNCERRYELHNHLALKRDDPKRGWYLVRDDVKSGPSEWELSPTADPKITLSPAGVYGPFDSLPAVLAHLNKDRGLGSAETTPPKPAQAASAPGGSPSPSGEDQSQP